MDAKAVSQQLLVEHEMLMHVTNALRTILDWKGTDTDLSRKLSSLRFVTQSFQRHLDRLMGLEEHDGYMEVVVKAHPELLKEVDALRVEHEQFRNGLNRIVYRLEGLGPAEHEPFEQVCEKLKSLLEQVDLHSGKETELLQNALLTEEGGEG